MSFGKLYHEEYRINPIPFDPASDTIQFYCAFHSCWKPGFIANSGGGKYALYTLVKSGSSCSVSNSGQKSYRSGICFSYTRSRKMYQQAESLGPDDLVRKSVMVHFTPFHELISTHFFPEQSGNLPVTEPERIERIMDQLYEELGKEKPDQAFLSGLFLQMLQEASRQQKRKMYPDILHNALQYIETHINDPELSRETIAAACGTSIRTLGRMFTELIGTPLIRYVIKQRLDQVCGMLALPRFSIKEIASRCGFSSAGFMTAQFRQHYGVTPKAYRKNLFERDPAENL